MRIAFAALALSFALAGCGGDSCKIDTTYDPVIDPAKFVAVVDNPFYPLTPGVQYQ